MLNQCKYAARPYLYVRLCAIAGVILLNLIAGLVSSDINTTISIIAVLASALVWPVTCIVADYDTIRSMYTAPISYHTFLAPVKGRTILFSRLLVMLLQDFIGMAICLGGLLLQLIIVDGVKLTGNLSEWLPNMLLIIVFAVLQYLSMLLHIILVVVLVKSLLASAKAKVLLALVSVFLFSTVLGWINLLLGLTGAEISRYRFLFNVQVEFGFTAGMMLFLVILLVKNLILFFTSSYLMERRINL